MRLPWLWAKISRVRFSAFRSTSNSDTWAGLRPRASRMTCSGVRYPFDDAVPQAVAGLDLALGGASPAGPWNWFLSMRHCNRSLTNPPAWL